MDSKLTPPAGRSAAAGKAELLKYSYVALAVESSALEHLNRELKGILGEAYADLKSNRDDRDGGPSSYHMTVIAPSEFRQLKKALKKDGQRLEIPREPFGFEILGIGTAENEQSSCWFAVCNSASVAAWRKSLDLPPKDLHITLAFGAEGDVHGVPKGISSLLTTENI